MWWLEKKPPFWLRGLSHVYQRCSASDQQKRLKKAMEPPLPLISIGNITVGGSGKTPFVVWLAKALSKQGFQPVILCRGDGGKQKKPVLLTHSSKANTVGDEAVLLKQLTNCPVIAGKDRVRGAYMARHHGNMIILDDGFQYKQLHRHCDIVLIPSEGIGNGCLIPAGPLREPPSALQRADIIVRSGDSDFTPLSTAKEWHWQASNANFHDWMNCGYATPTHGIAITAIARPQRFIQSLQSQSIQLHDSYIFPDHYTFTPSDINPLLAQQKPIITTAKDAVKLREIWPKYVPLWVLEQQADAEEGLLNVILKCLSVGRQDAG